MGGTFFSLCWLATLQGQVASQQQAEYLRAATDAAAWLTACATATPHGLAWPKDPATPGARPTNLYSGSAGVVRFFLALAEATGERRYLDTASKGAAHLCATLPKQVRGPSAGLYTGVAGIGWVLLEVARATGSDACRRAARECVGLIERGATEAGAGIEWGGVTDVISGGAGIGLFLLAAGHELDDARCRALARKAGLRLVELAQPAAVGRTWAMAPRMTRSMPNFSHGTAGVAFFLARLYRATGERTFLDAALDGGRYLTSIADRSDGGCRVRHHTPGGENLYYLGWCHGPVGTAQLFRELFHATGDLRWLRWVERCATSILDSGIPEQRTPGFWNNAGVCCGSAGVVAFFADLHAWTGKREYRAFAERVARDLIARARREEHGICWPQAEHRVRPALIEAQTGFMQGAAGVGLALLHLERRFERSGLDRRSTAASFWAEGSAR